MDGGSTRGLIDELREDLKHYRRGVLRTILAGRGFHALMCYRLAHRAWRRRIPILPQVLTRIIQILYAIDIDWRAEIEGGVGIFHGAGIVIGAGARVGAGTRIYHGVTLGRAHRADDGFPRIGRRVLLGAGAAILGPVSVGDDSVVGANTVVSADVPEASLVAQATPQVRPLGDHRWTDSVGPARDLS